MVKKMKSSGSLIIMKIMTQNALWNIRHSLQNHFLPYFRTYYSCVRTVFLYIEGLLTGLSDIT